jgi:two-component system sensor histidine kinase/response regulator
LENKNLILIVDDQPKNLQLAATVLNPYYKLLIAGNGTLAIKIAKDKKPDLILLDIMMLDMSGYDVCIELKKTDETRDIPIIFLTAKTEEQDIVKGFEIGGVDYITKPFKAKEMLARIKTHIDLRQANKTIEKQNRELVVSNSEKDKFFSIIAHDLRSPFTGFLSLTQMLAEEFEDFSKEEMVKTINSLKDSATILYKLLENLLNWSLIKRGLMEFNFERINLYLAVNSNLELLEQRAMQKGIALVNNTDINTFIYSDKNIIHTILRNLLSNAVKFTSAGGSVSVSSKDLTNVIEITVSDTGVGMSDKDVDKLFKIDEKVSHKGTEGEPSTGLGLLLCKELVEKNNGEIFAKSELGKGSQFIFTVPKAT